MASLAGEEVIRQANALYPGYSYEVMLVYSTGDTYTGETTYADVLADELAVGVGGYQRVSFDYEQADLTYFADGVFTEERKAVFMHDGSVDTQVFNAIALVRVKNGSRELVGYDYVGSDTIFTSGQAITIRVSLLHGEP